MNTQMIITYDAKGNKVVLHVKAIQTANRYNTRLYLDAKEIESLQNGNAQSICASRY